MAREEFNMPLKISRWEVIDELAMLSNKLSPAQKEKIETGIRALVKQVLSEKEERALPTGKLKDRDGDDDVVEKAYIGIESKIAKMKKPTGSTISITEGPNDAYFILNVNSRTKSFTIEEMRKMVKIAQSSDDLQKTSKELYRWFENVRKDVIFDLELSRTDVKVPEIILFLKSRYAVKQK